MTEPVRTLREMALSAYGPTALSAVGSGAVLPVVVLSARDLGAGVNVAAFMIALRGIGQLAGDLPAGALAARVGERAALIVACGLEALGVGAMFIASARSCRTALVPLWAEAIGLDAARTSLVFGIAGAVDMLLFYPAGGVMDRFGRMWVAVPSMLVLGVGMFLLPLTHTFAALTAVAVVLGIGNGIGSGLVMTLGADASPADVRVQFLGGWRLMSDSGNAAGPAVISGLTTVIPLAGAAVAMGAVAVVGAGWLRVWVPRFDPVSRRAATTAALVADPEVPSSS